MMGVAWVQVLRGSEGYMMGTGRKLLILLALVVAFVLVGSAMSKRVFQRPVADSGVIFEPSKTYTSSQPLDQPLVVVAEDVTLDEQVNGNTALVGQTITVASPINGDLTLIGDHLSIAETGRVAGDAAMIGGDISISGSVEGGLTAVGNTLTIGREAQISGDVFACVKVVDDQRPDGIVHPCGDGEGLATIRALDTAMRFDSTVSGAAGFPVAALMLSAFTSLVLTGIAALAVAAFPRQISYIEEAIVTAPRRLGQAGFLMFLLAAGVTAAVVVLLAAAPPVGLLALPVFALGGLVFLGMTVTGWITVALVIGNWLLRRGRAAYIPPLVTAAVGSILLFALWHVLALLPFGVLIVLLAMAVLGSVGLGAAVTTRMGTRSVSRRYFVQG